MSTATTFSMTPARSISAPKLDHLSWLDVFAIILVICYLVLTRSFAHIGISPLYIGEVAFVTFALSRRDILIAPLLGSLVRPSVLSGFTWCAYLFIAFGAAQLLRGVAAGFSLFVAAQNLAFHVYVLFIFVGIWVGGRHPDLLPKLVRWLAWANGIYGFFYITILSPMGVTVLDDGETLAYFGQPYGSSVALLGLLAFETKWRWSLIPLVLNSFVLLGLQMRATWLGFTLAMLLWGFLAGKLSQMAKVAGVVIGLLIVGWVTDFRMPAPVSRGGEISTRALVARAISSFSREKAAEWKESDDFAGTVDWRKDWWDEIWKNTHSSTENALIGPGYGFPLWDLNPFGVANVLRTPHNIFIHALGYTGWVGVGVFVVFMLALLRLLWRGYRFTGQPFGPCLWVLIVTWSAFDDLIEAPFGAIPFYVLCGLAVAPLVVGANSRPTVPEATAAEAT